MSYPTEDDIIDLDKIDGEAWNQHPEETDKAYQAFQIYKDLGRKDRNKMECYLAYSGKSRDDFDGNSAPSFIYEWAKKYNWDDRVKEWDKHIDKKREEKYEEEMLEYSKDMAKSAQWVAKATLEGLKARLEGKNPEEIEKLLFEDEGMGLEDISRTLSTAKGFANEAFGNLTEDSNDKAEDADFLAAVKELD